MALPPLSEMATDALSSFVRPAYEESGGGVAVLDGAGVLAAVEGFPLLGAGLGVGAALLPLSPMFP
ncbi:hypothetical protein GCM10009612_42260 [Streptomyces beijiangensis]